MQTAVRSCASARPAAPALVCASRRQCADAPRRAVQATVKVLLENDCVSGDKEVYCANKCDEYVAAAGTSDEWKTCVDSCEQAADAKATAWATALASIELTTSEYCSTHDAFGSVKYSSSTEVRAEALRRPVLARTVLPGACPAAAPVVRAPRASVHSARKAARLYASTYKFATCPLLAASAGPCSGCGAACRRAPEAHGAVLTVHFAVQTTGPIGPPAAP